MADMSKAKAVLQALEGLSPAGFAIAFHVRLTAPDFLFQTYPKPWIDTYSEKGYVMADPIVRWGFTETGWIRWSDLAHLDQVGVLPESKAFGMNFGVAIATDEGGSRSFAGLARPDREYTDEEIATLTDLVLTLHAETASAKGMDAALRAQLHELSVKMTHPAPRK